MKTSPTSLAAMLAAGNYDGYVNPNITEAWFPVNPALFTTTDLRMFDAPKEMTDEEFDAMLEKEGYEDVGIEQALAFGEENPEEQRKGVILARRSSWVGAGGPGFVILTECDNKRAVCLSWDIPVEQWIQHDCRVLAAPKKPKL